MKRFVLLFLLVNVVYFANAQKECSKSMNNPITVKSNEKSATLLDFGENYNQYGSFQFLVSKNSKNVEIFTDNILTVIEENRLENEENIITLSPNTRVRILSKKQLIQSDFHPFTKLYTIE